MNSDKKIDTADTQGQASSALKSSSRRRLLQAGIGASPVILSVIARPVRAAGYTPGGTKTCRSASAFASVAVNPASSHSPSDSCTGNGPAWWKPTFYNGSIFVPQSLWITGSVSTALSTFVAGGGTSYPVTTPGTGVLINNPTLAELLAYSTGTSAIDQLARNIAAARLNIAVGATPLSVIPLDQLGAMWQAVQGGGTYTVSPGVVWHAADINTWLVQSTFNTP